MLQLSRLASTALTLAVLSLSHQASAATCATDADCDKGFSCQQSAETTACACPANAACDCAMPAPTFECAPLVNCTADADCASGMVCSETTCVPQWTLPCTTASDCGEGFDCVNDVSGMCSGSSGTATSGSGVSSSSGDVATGGASSLVAVPVSGGTTAVATTTTTVPECTTVTLDTKSCSPKQIACTSVSDCPATWTCEANVSTTCSGGAAEAVGGAPSVGTSSCTTTQGPSYCMPPFAQYAGIGKSASDGSVTETSSGNAGAAGAPTASAGGDDANTADPESSGCQLGAGTARGAFGVIPLLLGLLLVRRRRAA